MGRYAPRRARRAYAAAGLIAIAAPASATALAYAATPPPASAGGLEVKLTAHRIAYGRDVVARGQANSSQAGETVALQFESAGAGSWRTVASSQVGGDGHFRLAAALRRSGRLRVLVSGQGQGTSTTAQTTTTAPSASAAQDVGGAATAPQRVTVAARLWVHHRTLAVLGQTSAVVRGRLLPGAPGRRIRVQGFRSGHWQTVAAGRTSGRGGFALRLRPHGLGSERLRVVFRGDRLNGPAHEGAGSLVLYTQSLASWYNDGGNTACGFHAYYGVANVSLPCGTKVSFSYGGRTVNAVVDDRGPYAGGRRWDLNQNTASALGFGGVGDVWSSQ